MCKDEIELDRDNIGIELPMARWQVTTVLSFVRVHIFIS